MSPIERPFRVNLDKFHHLLITKLGPIYVAFLYRLIRVSVKGPITPLPTIELFKDAIPVGTDQYRKRIVDSLFELYSKAEGEADYIKTALQIEHQHRNQLELNYRMFDYLNPLAQHYRYYEIAQILVYTGDEPFKSPTKLKFRDTDFNFRLVDLTQHDYKDFISYPHFGVQLLCIFSHHMPEDEKVRFLVERFRAFRKQYGRAETQFYIDLLVLAMTKHNANAIDAITTQLSFDTEFEEMIALTPYYAKVWEEAKEEGVEEGIEKGKIMSALALIRKGKMSLAELAETLELTPAEIAALESLLQQSSNGNGKHE
jgi:predicted transposase/invertase (TIGR01784 family)